MTATATLKRSKLGSGAARVGASGKAKVRIRFTPKAARSLRERRSVRLAIAVRFTPAERRRTHHPIRLTDPEALARPSSRDLNPAGGDLYAALAGASHPD